MAEMGLKLEHVQYLLDIDWRTLLPESPNTNLYVGKMRALLTALGKAEEARKADEEDGGEASASEVDEDALCRICYCVPSDALFFPCKHTSCYSCITRHLADNKRCFFCNADVERVDRTTS
eukprot:TRINITY_DN3282_c0_g1_i1.p1 TRINITY_DN3282_c0_g1~~TRINITY_DN3282_c0_g1_i1.p1  ORF type:complete len:131 (-),score=40.70 TRINITY_DN3282_c0_g1_i1:165-527(-)